MKSIIFICLLVPLCYAQRGPSNILNQITQAIKTAKSNVNSATSDIQRASRTFKMNTDMELSNINSQSFRTISDVETRRLNDIKKQIEDAKAAGKDVAVSCLNGVSSKMRTDTQSGYAALNQCREQGNRLVAQKMAEFDSATITGQQLLNKLDGIALQCYASDIFQMANCMTMNLAALNPSIRAYQNTAKQLEQNSQSNKNKIVQQIRNCNSQAVSAVQSASIDAIYAAGDCLKK